MAPPAPQRPQPGAGPRRGTGVAPRGRSNCVGKIVQHPAVALAQVAIDIKPVEGDHLGHLVGAVEVALGQLECVRRQQVVGADDIAARAGVAGDGDREQPAGPDPTLGGDDKEVDVRADVDVVHRQLAGNGDHPDERERRDQPTVVHGAGPGPRGATLTPGARRDGPLPAGEGVMLADAGEEAGGEQAVEGRVQLAFREGDADQVAVNLSDAEGVIEDVGVGDRLEDGMLDGRRRGDEVRMRPCSGERSGRGGVSCSHSPGRSA